MFAYLLSATAIAAIVESQYFHYSSTIVVLS